MPDITVTPLASNLTFGARISGVTLDNAKDARIRQGVNDVFTERGMIVFEGLEPTNAMQVAVSEIFGDLENHALSDVPMADEEVRGMTDFTYEDIFSVNGKELSGFIPWHFDACYTKELNRGGVLRAITISPEGGLTGFADGVQLYKAIDPALRDKFEGLNIIYHSHLMFMNLKFGRPESYEPIKVRKMITDMLDSTKDAPRSVHPAIWQRPSGEKVLHVSPWQAAGIEGMDNAEGDALLRDLVREINAKATPYFHRWSPTDMVIWDNWRFIHSASGNPPQHRRRMQRTTIKGDYGLGRFEDPSTSQAPMGVSV